MTVCGKAADQKLIQISSTAALLTTIIELMTGYVSHRNTLAGGLDNYCSSIAVYRLRGEQ